MPDTIRKIVIPKEELPLVQFTTTLNTLQGREEIDELYYKLRYRIIGEDRNRNSHWSFVKKLVVPDIASPFPYTGAGRISLEKSAGHVNVLWFKPQIEEQTSDFEKLINQSNEYDVWARWNPNNTTNPLAPNWGEWQFEGTVVGNTWSGFPPGGAKSIEVAIQAPSQRKVRDYNNNKLTLFTGIRDAL